MSAKSLYLVNNPNGLRVSPYPENPGSSGMFNHALKYVKVLACMRKIPPQGLLL